MLHSEAAKPRRAYILGRAHVGELIGVERATDAEHGSLAGCHTQLTGRQHIGAGQPHAHAVVRRRIHLTSTRIGHNGKTLIAQPFTHNLHRDRIKGAHSMNRNAKRFGHHTRCHQANAQTCERAGADTHCDRVKFGGCNAGIVESLRDGGCKQLTM